MNPVPLLDRKRRGDALDDEEIAALIKAFVDDDVADYQMSAFAMAVCCRGMTAAETTALTRAMLESGRRLVWEPGPPVVDKHSTGGQGDKSSLILAPLVASLGFRVPMISGRGLGPTGGTLDKLSAIPGLRTDLSLEKIQRQVADVGCVMAGQTAELCPADRELYALRDASGTVVSMPLITSSILCKKLAESLDALVLDVKFGAGAFMTLPEDSRTLARSLVDTAKAFGLRVTALLTSMEQPTGRMVGNAVEVMEAVSALQGRGPNELMELVERLAAELLVATEIAANADEAAGLIRRAIDSGAAWERFREMIHAQGGNADAGLNVAPIRELNAERSGYISSIDGAKVGSALIALGGGRVKTTDGIDPSVGFEFLVRLGETISAGQTFVRMFAHGHGREQAATLMHEAIAIADEPPAVAPLVLERIV
nr:pyrimidine-nucleoside phosphorylase [uncultured bacterium]